MNILKWLFGTENRHNDKVNVMGSYYSFLIEKDKETNKLKQKWEDEKVEREIKYEAMRMWNEWNNAPMIKVGDKEFKNCLLLMRPFGTYYTVYDTDLAKFLETDINKLVWDEFKILKNKNFGDNTNNYNND